MMRASTIRLPAALLLFAVLASLSCGDDDNNGTGPQTQPPVIQSVVAVPDTFNEDEITTVTVTADDPDGDSLRYSWEASASWVIVLGVTGGSAELSNCCPIVNPTSSHIICTVDDYRGGEVRDSVQIWVLPHGSGR